MSYTLTATVSFGAASGSLATVGYQLKEADGTNSGARQTAGVAELAAGSGEYRVVLTLADAFRGFIVWDSGESPPKYASEAINPPGDVWDVPDTVWIAPGTFGGRVALGLAQDAIRAWVWNALRANHTGAGTFGEGAQVETGYGGPVADASPLGLTLAAVEGTRDYRGWMVDIVSGPGAGQARAITSYAPVSRVAGLDRPWDTLPTTSSVYRLSLPVTLDAGGLDALPIEDGLHARHALRGIAAAALGRETRPDANTVMYAAAGDPGTPRVSAALHPTTRIRQSVLLDLGA